MALSSGTGRHARIAPSVDWRSGGTASTPTSATRASTNLPTSAMVGISRRPQVRGLREKWMPPMSSDNPSNLLKSNIPAPFVKCLFHCRTGGACSRQATASSSSSSGLPVGRLVQPSSLVDERVGRGRRGRCPEGCVSFRSCPWICVLPPSAGMDRGLSGFSNILGRHSRSWCGGAPTRRPQRNHIRWRWRPRFAPVRARHASARWIR